jgi:hypothetical protein
MKNLSVLLVTVNKATFLIIMDCGVMVELVVLEGVGVPFVLPHISAFFSSVPSGSHVQLANHGALRSLSLRKLLGSMD